VRAIWILIRLTFLESVRRKIAQAGFILGIAFLTLFGIAFHFTSKRLPQEENPAKTLVRKQICNIQTMAGLYAINFLTIAMSALIAADSLSGEISSGVIQTVAAKPIRRWQIVAGKWLGFAGLIGIYLMMMAGGLLTIVYLTSGYMITNVFAGIFLIYLETILIMTLSLACSSSLSTLASGGAVFGMYGVAFIGGWVEQIGAALKSQTAVNVGIISSFIIPSEVLWRFASYKMTSALIQSLGFGAGPFSVISVPSPLMIVYAAVYMTGLLLFAIRQFSNRDL